MFSALVLTVRCDRIGRLPWDASLFKTLRKMNDVRPFKLVFSTRVPYVYEGGDVKRELMGALDSVIEKGFLNFLDSPPDIRIVRAGGTPLAMFSPSHDCQTQFTHAMRRTRNLDTEP